MSNYVYFRKPDPVKPLQTNLKYPLRTAAILLVICSMAFSSCRDNTESGILNANVLLYWPTDETDPAYRQWTETAEKELHRQGIYGDVQVHFGHATERYESTERPMLDELILKLRTEGSMPDLILSYGDVNRWLLTTDINPVTASIPVVCYGLNFDEYLPYQYDILDSRFEGGRWNDRVDIFERYSLKENLLFASRFVPYLIEDLKKKGYANIGPNRLITLLDREMLWTDKIRFNDLRRQMEELDPAVFYDNLIPRGNEDRINTVAFREKRIVLSCRSLMSPSLDLSINNNQIPTTWAFYPQKSSNFFIQAKHDNKSRGLVEGPSFMQYCTMRAEDFLVNEKCIGGYFSTFEEQIKDAVSAGKRLLEGETPEQIGKLEHRKTWNLNWDAVRHLGLDVNSVPSSVQLYNVVLKDRNPRLYSTLLWLFWTAVALTLVWSTLIIIYYSVKAHKNDVRICAYANESIRNNGILNQMMDVVDFRTWQTSGKIPDNFSRITASEFFKDKLRDFLKVETPGNYSMQMHCSIDGKPAHWYEIRMTVSLNQDSVIERRGIIINNDRQKELEAIEAETNRIITSTRTREGFIASMNHEIRTPLNSIVGYAQLLAMPGMPIEEEELKEYSEAITSNSSILQNTIRNILTAAAIGKNPAEPRMETVNLPDFLNGMKEELVRISGREIIFESGPEDLRVMVDRKMLSDILENLVLNAALFSAEPSGIKIGWDKSGSQDLNAEIRVEDRGIGIEAKNLDLIFERFFKVDSFTPGCGLGLYICKTFVENMGGQISVQSTVGEGSVFKIGLA